MKSPLLKKEMIFDITAGYNSGELECLISIFRWVRFPHPLILVWYVM